jgi:hypothetical protein
MKFAVYRRVENRTWVPISCLFPTHAQAHRYVEGLPVEWQVEVREVQQ